MKKTIKIFLHLFSITVLASAVFLGGIFDRLLTKINKNKEKDAPIGQASSTFFTKEALADVPSDGGGWSSGDGCGDTGSSSGGDTGC